MEKLKRRESWQFLVLFLFVASACGFFPLLNSKEEVRVIPTITVTVNDGFEIPIDTPRVEAATTVVSEASVSPSVGEIETEPGNELYPVHKDIVASVFWVGEGVTEDNDFITNAASAWAGDWVGEFGGVDNPDERSTVNPFFPAGFISKENPFYVALPVAEFSETGLIAGARESSPWAHESAMNGSLFKNRWVKVIREDEGGQSVCYAQWEDVGPAGQDGSVEQYEYVFGDGEADNTFGLGAGIDLSPACAIALGMDSNASMQSGLVDWQFVDFEDVPDGPWKTVVTTSGPSW